MKVYNFIQQSPEWYECRKGKITASHAQAIANCGKGLDTYINELMAEYFSKGVKEQFTSKHTERGNELEAEARVVYEMTSGNTVEEVGFIEYNEFVGASPDGLIGDDGGLEIKCPDDNGYFEILLNGESEIDTKYLWQIQMCLLITERKWWDFVAYNPNFDTSIIIHRIFPDKEKQDKLLKGFLIAEQKIKEIINKLK